MVWEDPPFYWDRIVYPAYKRAHQHLFKNGDVEKGELSGNIKGLRLFEGSKMNMEDMLERVCRDTLNAATRLTVSA